MGTEIISETPVFLKQLTLLITWEDFINIRHRESFRSHNNYFIGIASPLGFLFKEHILGI
jgi:hypothetical protein